MFKISVEAATLEELKAKTKQMLDAFSMTQTIMTAEVAEVDTQIEERKVAKKASKKKTTKKTTKKKEEAKVSPHVVTNDDCMKKLQEVNSALGLAAVRRLLGGFGADRISNLEEKDFEAFVQACETELANAEENQDA